MLKRPTILNTIGKRPENSTLQKRKHKWPKNHMRRYATSFISNQGNLNLNHYDIPLLSILEKLKSAITGAAEFGSS